MIAAVFGAITLIAVIAGYCGKRRCQSMARNGKWKKRVTWWVSTFHWVIQRMVLPFFPYRCRWNIKNSILSTWCTAQNPYPGKTLVDLSKKTNLEWQKWTVIYIGWCKKLFPFCFWHIHGHSFIHLVSKLRYLLTIFIVTIPWNYLLLGSIKSVIRA